MIDKTNASELEELLAHPDMHRTYLTDASLQERNRGIQSRLTPQT